MIADTSAAAASKTVHIGVKQYQIQSIGSDQIQDLAIPTRPSGK
jgi:hypothetical protein